MLGTAQFDKSDLVPSDPAISYCPAAQSEKQGEFRLSQVTMTTYTDSIRFREKEVVAVLGPLACDVCDRNCDDAYLALSPRQKDILLGAGAVIASTPVSINLLDKKRNVSIVRVDYDRSVDESSYTGTFGWDAKCQSQITDDLIATEGSTVVSVAPDGSIALHAESFQPELTELTPTRTVQQPLADQDGQGRLF